MNDLIKEAKISLSKQSAQGIITLLLVLTLCYAVIVDPASYKDLFAYAVTGSLGFYFGRETKAEAL